MELQKRVCQFLGRRALRRPAECPHCCPGARAPARSTRTASGGRAPPRSRSGLPLQQIPVHMCVDGVLELEVGQRCRRSRSGQRRAMSGLAWKRALAAPVSVTLRAVDRAPARDENGASISFGSSSVRAGTIADQAARYSASPMKSAPSCSGSLEPEPPHLGRDGRVAPLAGERLLRHRTAGVPGSHHHQVRARSVPQRAVFEHITERAQDGLRADVREVAERQPVGHDAAFARGGRESAESTHACRGSRRRQSREEEARR